MKSIYDDPLKMLTKDSYPATHEEVSINCVECSNNYYINVWEYELDFNRIIEENEDCFAVILSDKKGHYGLIIDPGKKRWDAFNQTICKSVKMVDQSLIFSEPEKDNKFWFFSHNGNILFKSFDILKLLLEINKQSKISKKSNLRVCRIER